MMEWIKRVLLALRLKAAGELLVNSVNCEGVENLYYSVNELTGLYTFWRYTDDNTLEKLDADLNKNQALFQMFMYGGIA